MTRNVTDRVGLSRRNFIASGSVGVGGLLAGCVSGSDADDSRSADDAGTNADDERREDGGGGNGSYSVTMEPMGEVEFESVPETWMAYFSNYGDMAIALGQLDGLRGLIYTENWPMAFYDALPDVEVSFDDVPQLMGESGIDKEVFYELDCDVHLMDPNFISRLADNWEEDDYEEIATEIGPVIGNSIRRRDEEWHDYPYYTLYEAFEKIADVFDQRGRYEAFERVHDRLLSDVRESLPPEEERPTVGLVSINSDFENGAFYVYPIHGGNGHKQYRDLGMRGAFDDHIEGSYAQWDYEQLLEVDPDILLFQYGFSHVSTEGFEQRIAAMGEDPIGRELAAVRNDRLYRGGTAYQGPIVNLFQTEIAAKQFYPETFGEWNGLETLSNEDERLFDYQRVADIVNGDW